ncbi:MAG: hypothetical protein EB153_07795 [Nitrosopumilaceae archaeon]|nr:hypothetical protein [Nitrosopumilaceae archaeon]
MYTLRNDLGYSKKTITICLVAIAILSLGLKLYTTNFSVLPSEDTFGYVLRAISHMHGDFTEPARKTLGWSIFVSPFFEITHPNSFLDYVNIVRGISLGISTITILPMYALARRFFDEKYSLVAAFLFAIESHLNYNAGLGLSEPLFILVAILAIYFILNKKPEYSFLSFLLVGVLWWIRFNGVVMLLVISIIYLANFQRSRSNLLKLVIGILMFLAVSSPMLIQKYQQYGDPLYFSQGSALYTGDYSAILAENTKSLNYSPLDYIHDHGIAGFLQKFIAGGIYHVLDQAAKLSLPYLFYMLPFGILFSFRAFDQNPKYIRANWIVILITLGSFVTYFAVVQERRLIFHTVPFLIIFAVIPIQRLVEYGFSTFSFSKKQKNLVLTIILIIAFTLALLFTTRYQPVDVQLENEKLEFAKYALSHYEGKLVDTGDSLQTLRYVILTEKQDFKQYLTKNDDQFSKTDKLDVINLYASSLNDFINVSKQYDVKYLIVNKNSITQEWYPYMDDVYDNNHPYLKKVFDPVDLGFKKLNVRVFQIDYSEFDRMSK